MVSKKINYVRDALPPASSICFLASAASLHAFLNFLVLTQLTLLLLLINCKLRTTLIQQSSYLQELHQA
jgi:hypothetical protein